MTEPRYRLRVPQITFDEAMAAAHRSDFLAYGAKTCWWNIGGVPNSLPSRDGRGGIPCDPRRGVLYQTDRPAAFLQAAADNPEYYGRHGLRAFMAAYHGNVLTADGQPWCFVSWEEYNALLDATGEGPASDA